MKKPLFHKFLSLYSCIYIGIGLLYLLVAALLIQPGRDLLTLVTCHPLGSNRQRYVVYCERTE